MATGNSFTIRVYGEVAGQPPYITPAGGNLPGIQATYPTPLDSNFPAGGNLNVWPIGGYGAVMTGNVSCYAVIEIPPTGLNQISDKFVVQQTVAQVATLRNV
jgi:hypothetical protein